MFTENKDNTATVSVNQTQKPSKERTMATDKVNSLNQVDITQATTLEEQAIILQNNQDYLDSPTIYVDDIANYLPGKNQEQVLDGKDPLKKETEPEGYISSYVGDYTSDTEKGIVANLGNDVAFVQKHLNRLGILSDEDYIVEKPTSNKEISKDIIPKTIDAINWFQSKVLHYNTKYGYVIPGKGTILSLVTITVEQKDSKYQEYLALKKKEEDKKEEEKKAKEELDKKAKIKAENDAKEKLRIEKIKNAPATKENLKKYYNQAGSIEAFGKFLSDYVILNPDFVIKAYDLMGFMEPDVLTRAIMYNLSDTEINELPETVDTKFYKALDAWWTTDKEYALMAKLKANKKPVAKKMEERGSKKDSEQAEKDLQIIRGMIDYKLKANVGEKGKSKKEFNRKEDVKQVALQLKNKKYTVSKDSLVNGVYDEILKNSIGEFQKEINKDKKKYTPSYIVEPGKETYKKLFEVKDYNSGLDSIYGKSEKSLNKKLDKEDAKLGRLNRDLEYDSKVKKNIGSFDETETISKEDYSKSVEKIGEKIGVKEDSDESKILDIIDKAVNNQEYFKEFTKDVSSELVLSSKSLGSNTVNPILEYRLKRYHKVMVAVGLFNGNMTGDACRDEATAHKWSIYHYWKTNNDKLTIIKENLVKMYNKELKPDGKECVDKNGNVTDLDGYVWAKKEHFSIDDKGKATKLNTTWDTFMDSLSQSRVTKDKNDKILKDWRLESAAEGYTYGDHKRYPMPLRSGMPRSNHITGDAIDINYGNFTKMNDAMNDLIALCFGLIRPVGGEQWHFEITNVEFSKEEKKLLTKKE